MLKIHINQQFLDEDTIFKEVVVTPDSPLLNRNRTYLRRKTSNSLILMAKPNAFSWLMEDMLIPNYHYILLMF